MRLLTRYVLSELLKVFALSLTGLTVLIIIGGVVNEAIKQSLPPAQVLGLIPYILPDALRISIPVTLLLSATTVYGRMSGSNEIVAVKALGISPWVLIWPALAVAFLVSLVTVWLNDLAVSWGRNGAQRVVIDSVEEIAYSMLRTQKRYSSPFFAINVRQVRDRKLMNVTLSLQGRDKAPTITIRAEEAELRCDHEENVLKILLRNGKIEVEGGVSMRFPGEYEQVVPLQQASRARTVTPPPSWLPLRRIPDEIVAQQQVIEELEEEMSTLAAYQMVGGDFDELTGAAWETRETRLTAEWSQLCRLCTEPHRRWSAGFSCLCFVWVGVPMAIWLRNRDYLTSFFLCFLPILIVYYPLLIYGVDGAKGGTIPPCSVWLGNVILIAWGVYLLRKVLRY
jgi:lipopolysaccharide export system permease protein